MVDRTRGKLCIPNWFSPYLEKHRIYELFHEMARELIIQQPQDHVLFLKEILYNAAASRYAPRVVILAPPHVNTFDISRALAQKCKAAIITERDINSLLDYHYMYRAKPKKMINCLHELLRSTNTYYTGWILPDFPKHRQEAVCMLHEGILPTHVFHIIPPFTPDLYSLDVENKSETWLNYRRTILGIREAFKSCLKDVHIGARNLPEVVQSCFDLINIKKRYNAPVIPRVCIIGPRGSGRRTQAKKLCSSFNLIYVDFEFLLCQAWISETHLGSLLRACKEKVGFNSLLLTAVVHKRLLEQDCVEYGWVLTGFPNTLEDFKCLDMIDTPPNRIIFLECDLNVCRERIIKRKVNAYTGSLINILENTFHNTDPDLNVHPKDKEQLFENEVKYYCENYTELRKYSGCTANIVDSSHSKERVAECLQAILMRPLPDCEPRTPCPSDTFTEKSDDLQDISIFDDQTDQDRGSMASIHTLVCTCKPCKNPQRLQRLQNYKMNMRRTS